MKNRSSFEEGLRAALASYGVSVVEPYLQVIRQPETASLLVAWHGLEGQAIANCHVRARKDLFYLDGAIHLGNPAYVQDDGSLGLALDGRSCATLDQVLLAISSSLYLATYEHCHDLMAQMLAFAVGEGPPDTLSYEQPLGCWVANKALLEQEAWAASLARCNSSPFYGQFTRWCHRLTEQKTSQWLLALPASEGYPALVHVISEETVSQAAKTPTFMLSATWATRTFAEAHWGIAHSLPAPQSFHLLSDALAAALVNEETEQLRRAAIGPSHEEVMVQQAVDWLRETTV